MVGPMTTSSQRLLPRTAFNPRSEQRTSGLERAQAVMNQRNKPSVSLMWLLLLLVASCHSGASSVEAEPCPGCGTGGSPNLGTGGSAGNANNSVDAGDADASGCPEPPQGCVGSKGVFITDPWFGWQLPDCAINYDTPLDSHIYGVYILVDCTLHYFAVGIDEGLMLKVGPTWQSDKGSMVTVTLTLSGEACDLVRANSDARVYVDLFTYSCPFPIGPT